MSEDAVLFGKTAVRRGFITQEQLEGALQHQRTKDANRPLGQILVEMGLITVPQATAIEELSKVLQRNLEHSHDGEESWTEEENLTGVTLGGCMVLDRIAVGSMGTTYRAHHMRLDRDVVVKVLHPRLVAIEGNVERFAREARAAANLEHPSIVSIYDFDSADGYHFIVMQYVKGQDLRQVLEARGALGPRRALWIAARVLEGLKHAHANGIVHRDIKPANLLITPEPRIKIADFGLVRLLSRSVSQDISVFGEIIGTPQYMAPEQACGDEFDHRVDLYALGITLWELVAGRPPFTGKSTIEVLEKHIVEPLPSICDAVDDAPPELDGYLQKLCAKAMDDRFATASDAITALQRLRFRIGAATGRLSASATGSSFADDPSRSVEPPAIVSEVALNELKDRLRRSRTFIAFEIDEDESGEGEVEVEGDDPIDAAFSDTEVASDSLSAARTRLEEAAANPDRLVPKLLYEMFKAGEYDELIALQKQLEALTPTSPAVAFFLGKAYEKTGQLEQARAKLALATVFAPDHLQARLHFARILVALGRVDEGVQALREASSWHPTSYKAAVRLAEVLYVVKCDAEAAVPAYERAIELKPTRWKVRQQLGWILYELGRFEKAEAVVREVVAWQKDNAPAKQLLKQIRRKRKKREKERAASDPRDEAVAEEESELEEVGIKTSACLDAIRLSSASGKHARAVEQAREGLKDKPQSVPLLLVLAEAQVKLGKLSDAVDTYGKALAIDPSNEAAQEGLMETQAARKKRAKKR